MKKIILTISAVISCFIVVSETQAKTGCFVEDERLHCYNKEGTPLNIQDWLEDSDYQITSYTTDGDKLIVTKKNGSVVEFIYDGSADMIINKYTNGPHVGRTTNTYTFDNDGNKISRITHNFSNYDMIETFYTNGETKQTIKRTCAGSSTINDNGYCTEYSSGEDYTYDNNGNQTGKSLVSCSGNTCTMEIYSCTTSCSLTNQYTVDNSADGMICTPDNSTCIDMDASHCSIQNTDGSCAVCKGGYGFKKTVCVNIAVLLPKNVTGTKKQENLPPTVVPKIILKKMDDASIVRSVAVQDIEIWAGFVTTFNGHLPKRLRCCTTTIQIR